MKIIKKILHDIELKKIHKEIDKLTKPDFMYFINKEEKSK